MGLVVMVKARSPEAAHLPSHDSDPEIHVESVTLSWHRILDVPIVLL